MSRYENYDTEELIHAAVRAALRAGEEIMKIYVSDFLVEHKPDDSPLTLADKNAHNTIIRELAGFHIPVLSEEGVITPYSERKKWDTLWVVDPLDGTKEFVKRNGEFTVNIALVHVQHPVLGVIYQPVSRMLYFGSKQTGAYRVVCPVWPVDDFGALVAKGEKLPLDKKHTKFIVAASRSHMDKQTRNFVDELIKTRGEVEMLNAGSSVKFCLVAEGSADIYPRFAPTSEWDTAAGQAIAEAAGKKVIDQSTGKSMIYNREDLKNPGFVVS